MKRSREEKRMVINHMFIIPYDLYFVNQQIKNDRILLYDHPTSLST